MGVKGRMRKLLRRPSPAMIVAVAGVAAAMSGDAVADGVKAVASVVGKDQVTSRSVKDGSLLLRDIKRSERAKLKGRRGPRGPQGASGTPALDQVFRGRGDAVAGLATAGGNAVSAKTRSRPGRSRIAASSSPTSRDPRETR